MYECNGKKFRTLKHAEVYANTYFKNTGVILGIFYKHGGK